MPPGIGWTSSRGSATPRRRVRRRLATVLLLLPLVIGAVGSPTAPRAQGDELSDAQARQADSRKRPTSRRRRSPSSRSSSWSSGGHQANDRRAERHQRRPRRREGEDHRHGDADRASSRRSTRRSSGASHSSAPSSAMSRRRKVPRRSSSQGGKALLAQRVRAAYDTDRTSLLESFLSGGSFSDLLTE